MYNIFSGPGAFICLVNFPSSDQYLSNDNTPILSPTCPFLVIYSNINIGEKQIVREVTDMNGFVIFPCQISVSSIQYHDTNCGRNTCDKQGWKSDVLPTKCSCFQMNNGRKGNVDVMLEVNVDCPDGTSFSTNMSNQWFLTKFITTGLFRQGTRVAYCEEFNVDNSIFNSVRLVVNYININGGFPVFGWVKCGEVQDQGVDQLNTVLAYNAQRVMVEAGTLNNHISRLDPMFPMCIDLEELKEKKFNSTNGFIFLA